ncbi:MAG TPA: CheR family methyltransferase, partial [Candidatus Aminicenantes bacterium]|nr:CheR family methyltransferase [Candidatus Aminicenantes bacterium]
MAFTFFFRDNHTLEQLVKHLLPTVQGRSNIKIWDAGCAMGPEPYTLAILFAEKMGKFAFKNVRIDASD